jgi:hypothetical protein
LTNSQRVAERYRCFGPATEVRDGFSFCCRALLIRLPCCISAFRVAVAMRKEFLRNEAQN